MAIANPSQELLVSCALATDLLLAKEEADIRYIEYAGMVAENRARKEAERGSMPVQGGRAAAGNGASQGSMENKYSKEGEALSREDRIPAGNTPSQDNEAQAQDRPPAESETRAALRNAVMKGNRNGIAAVTRQALAEGEEPASLLNGVLLPAINDVGELFDKGKYFLPQLIGSAEAMKNAIEVLEPLLLKETDAADMPTVVIATVEGDIHDIGKNLVALMLKNYGYRVIDLGKDVTAEKIVETAIEENAEMIGLSALMTTTMMRMKDVVELAAAKGCKSRIIIGGAAVTESFAQEIGAHGYSRDAAECVRLVERLLG